MEKITAYTLNSHTYVEIVDSCKVMLSGDVKLAGLKAQIEASCVSRQTEELWLN